MKSNIVKVYPLIVFKLTDIRNNIPTSVQTKERTKKDFCTEKKYKKRTKIIKKEEKRNTKCKTNKNIE